MGRASRQKLNRKITKLTEVMIQTKLTDIYRTFHQNSKEYTFSTTQNLLQN
jgi:exonuclease III